MGAEHMENIQGYDLSVGQYKLFRTFNFSTGVAKNGLHL